MNIVAQESDLAIRHRTRQALQRTLGQLCGLAQQVAFLQRARYGPRAIIGGVELTGVHILQGQPKPRGVSPYHIGGSGFVPEESHIRMVGEVAERYAQLVSAVGGRRVLWGNWEEIRTRGERVVSLSSLRWFAPWQYESPHFPFHPLSRELPLGWVRAVSLIEHDAVWIPAQLTLVGYAARTDKGEKRIGPAVTTGSAAHTHMAAALRNALLELIQVDSAMGHWYSRWKAYRIAHDTRTASIQAILKQYFHPKGPDVEFYWLPNPDLPGYSIVCLIRERRRYYPAVTVGLGIDLKLTRAMYKALLETIGSFGLCRTTLLESTADTVNGSWKAPDLDAARMFDLDANLVYCGFPAGAELVEKRFGEADPLSASDLPADSSMGPEQEVAYLVGAFRDSGKELTFLDLTIPEVTEMGFVAVRAWSPDLLPLALPSAPPLNHPRFVAYGGAIHREVHPYA